MFEWRIIRAAETIAKAMGYGLYIGTEDTLQPFDRTEGRWFETYTEGKGPYPSRIINVGRFQIIFDGRAAMKAEGTNRTAYLVE